MTILPVPPHSPPPPRLLDRTMRLEMALLIPMSHIIIESRREPSRTRPRRSSLRFMRMARPTRRLTPLLMLITPPSTPVERRRRPAELRASSTQAARGPAAGMRGGRVAAAGCWAGGGGSTCAVEVTVVAGLLFGGTEGGVGLGDLDEALGGFGVVGMEVGMVGFGKAVELPR